MRMSTFCQFAVCTMILTSIGCSSGQGIIRGQSPAPAYTQHGMTHAAQPGQVPQTPTMPMYYEGPASADLGMMQSQGMPYCPNGNCQYGQGYNGNCPPGAPCNNGSGGKSLFGPQHHHVYDYETPKNLVYPPANQQPAMVQYPYYTVRGPTDFFMK